MTGLLLALCGALGLAVGSFLNVVIWRLPRGESLARPPSHCPACDAPIRPYQNIPVVSWLALRGRCASCRTRISARYPAVELLTAGLFVVMAARFGAHPVLAAFLYLAAVGVALAAIDIDLHRLPDVLTLPSYPVGLGLLVLAALVAGHPGELLRAVIGMAALYAFYLVLRLIHPRGMGFGDVKLAGVLGLYLAFIGWGALVVGAFAGFLLGGLVGVGLLVAGAGRKARIPFGPYMLAGSLVGILAGQHVWHAYLHALGA